MRQSIMSVALNHMERLDHGGRPLIKVLSVSVSLLLCDSVSLSVP